MNLRRPAVWLWLFAFFSAIGLLFFGHYYLDDLARHHFGTGPRRLVEELTGAYSALALVPLIVAVGHRFPWRRKTWIPALAANAVGLALYTLLHTSIIAASRAALFPLLGLGPYDYGDMFYRYPMEAASDAIFYPIMALTFYFLQRLADARSAELQTVALQAELARAQLDNLKLQLHPHFLFNTLNAISGVMYEDVRKADEMIAKLSEFLRIVLASGGVDRVPVEEELRVERMYVEIMTTRLDRGIELNVEIDEEAQSAMVPFMLLQPLFENCIRHGMPSASKSLQLDVAVRRTNGCTVVSIVDNGIGIAPGHKSGIGLANVASRLSHMYGAGGSFAIECGASGGTRATISLPFEKGITA